MYERNGAQFVLATSAEKSEVLEEAAAASEKVGRARARVARQEGLLQAAEAAVKAAEVVLHARRQEVARERGGLAEARGELSAAKLGLSEALGRCERAEGAFSAAFAAATEAVELLELGSGETGSKILPVLGLEEPKLMPLSGEAAAGVEGRGDEQRQRLPETEGESGPPGRMSSHPLDGLCDLAPHPEDIGRSLKERLRGEEEVARQEAIRRSKAEAQRAREEKRQVRAGGKKLGERPSARAKAKSPRRRTPPGTPPRRLSAEAAPGQAGRESQEESAARMRAPAAAPASSSVAGLSGDNPWLNFDAQEAIPCSPQRPEEVPELDLENFFQRAGEPTLQAQMAPPPEEAQKATEKEPVPPCRGGAKGEAAAKPSLEEMLNQLHEGEDVGGMLERFAKCEPAGGGPDTGGPAPSRPPVAQSFVPPDLCSPEPACPAPVAMAAERCPPAAAVPVAAATGTTRRAHTAPLQAVSTSSGPRATKTDSVKKETLAERVLRRQGEHKQQQEKEQRQQEEVEAKRREVRTRLLSDLSPFMPEQHTLKPQISSLPNAKMGLPKAGEMCNRYCALTCVRESATGFLQAAGIKLSQNNPSVSQLQNALRKGLRRFHPDRNRAPVVGLEKSVMSEEQCKVASLLQTLFEEAESLDVTVAFASVTGGSWKFRTTRSSTLADIKQRVKDEDPSLSIESMQIKVRGSTAAPLSDGKKTLGEYGIQHNGILDLTIASGVGSRQQSNWARFE